MGMYQGVNASEGIGIGTVMVAVDPDLTFEPHEVADSAAEKERYQSALSVFCEKTQAQADHMKETVGEAEAEIMSGHIVLAQDPGMTDAINAAIDGGTCAEQALMDTSTMFENMFLSMDDEMFRLRAADIADIRTGILAELLGKECQPPARHDGRARAPRRETRLRRPRRRGAPAARLRERCQFRRVRRRRIEEVDDERVP